METIVRPLDVIGVYIDEKLAFFARVEEISPDVKPGWRKMRFLILNPAIEEREMTWILQPSQINGEPYSMEGIPVRIERLPDPVPAATESPPEEEPPARKEKTEKTARVIEFPGRREKH
ncbi:hypothetical protein EPN96_11935 [bacterium]|nr:MAG: hypothetical protein EPN96_11935 [bacterium]